VTLQRPELGNGEGAVPDAENFVVKSSGVSTSGGKTCGSNLTRTGKWLAAGSGDSEAKEFPAVTRISGFAATTFDVLFRDEQMGTHAANYTCVR
jgi:hypothetical protein